MLFGIWNAAYLSILIPFVTTVRQYVPPNCFKGGRSLERSQTVKQWETGGIGVPGDSGAWLIRRDNDAVMGLIWGRNYDYGSLTERIRLTYFTPLRG